MVTSLFFSLLNVGLLLFKDNLKRVNGENQGCCTPPIPPNTLVVAMNSRDQRKDLWAGNHSSFRPTSLGNRKYQNLAQDLP
jgi:hypothetical protein